ncbi:MAG: protein-glutamate O-methyltransferase CheR [Pseudomonadota bacterium]
MSGVLAKSNSRSASLLSDKQFDCVLELIYQLTGIAMTAAKRLLVERRIKKRMEALNFASFEEYFALLRRGDATEVELFTNAVTTNLTSFFRENHHFEFFREKFIPEIIRRERNSGKRMRVWSAGCSTGEEPYSIAITMREALRDIDAWDAKVLCTDIDSEVLKKCQLGVYSMDRIDGIAEHRVKKWFQIGSGELDGYVKARPELQDLLVIRKLNLIQPWPIRNQFDLIFCRNVMIYFDKSTQQNLVQRFAQHLIPGGYLIVGHSESLVRNTTQFELLGRTIYRKLAG